MRYLLLLLLIPKICFGDAAVLEELSIPIPSSGAIACTGSEVIDGSPGDIEDFEKSDGTCAVWNTTDTDSEINFYDDTVGGVNGSAHAASWTVAEGYSNDTSYINATLAGDQTKGSFSFNVYIDTINSGSTAIIAAVNATPNFKENLCNIAIANVNGSYYIRTFANQQWLILDTSLSLDTWYTIEAKYSEGAAGTVKVFAGASQVGSTIDIVSGTTGTVDNFTLGLIDNKAVGLKFYIDQPQFDATDW